MILNVYSVYDEISQCYGTPFFSMSDNVASRSFSCAAQDSNSMVFMNPQDFSLYQIGTFDDQTAILFPATTPRLITRASAFFEKQVGG